VSLLAGRKRGGGFGNGRYEGFVVSEKGERTTFEEKSKMFDGKESGQKFSVKSGIAGFCGRKFVGEKGQRLPGTMKTLLQDSANVGVGGVCGKGEGGRGMWVVERNSRGQ